MSASRVSERPPCAPRLFGSGGLRSSHFQDPRRHSAHYGKVRHVSDHYGIRGYDHIVPHTHAAQDLRPSAELDTVANDGCTERVVHTRVADCHAVTNQTIVADDSRAVYDDAAMMLDAQAATDVGGCADDNPADNFRELVEDDVGDRPGRAHYLVADGEAGVSETVHQQCPETDAEQPFALRLEVFQNNHQWVSRRLELTAEYPRCDIGPDLPSYAIVLTAATCRETHNKPKIVSGGHSKLFLS
jgi:hypothetical protein